MADRKNIGLAVVVGVGALIALSGDFSTGPPILPVDCEGLVASSRRVTCFDIPVEGATLAVAVVHDGDALEKAPVLVLPANPGEMPLADIERYAASPLAAQHDLVLVDPRGAGRSTPTLSCPDLQANPASAGQLEHCREDLADADAHLISIGTDTTVDDLEAVRRALRQGRSWGSWHVVGSGYGSQLGRRLAQVHHGGVASLTLSSVIPPDVTSITAGAHSFARALDAITALCEQDRGCDRFGSTTAAVNRIADRLSTRSEPLEVLRLDGTDRGDVVSFDGSLARLTFARALRDRTLAPLVPWAADRIDAAASEFGMARSGRETLAAMRAATMAGPAVSQAVFWTLVCSEQVPGFDQALLADLEAATPEMVAPIDPATACPLWSVPRAVPPHLDSPVRSRTLILTSPTDPWSSPAWADETAADLEGSVVVELATLGWSPGSTACEAELISVFIDDPGDLDRVACAAGPLEFARRPVPIAGAVFASVADETGPVASLVAGTLLAVGFAAWGLTGPPGAARFAWAIAAGATLVFLLTAGTVLAVADEPGRLVAQSGLTWPIFLLPWAIAANTLAAAALTSAATFAGRLRSPWPARHLVVGIGLCFALLGAVMAGMVPGL